MSVVKFTAHEGRGNNLDRSVQITEAIKRACYENGEGLALIIAQIKAIAVKARSPPDNMVIDLIFLPGGVA